MTDATLIADLIRAGVSPDLVGRVVNLVLSATVRGLSADTTDIRRERDRVRKREKRDLARLSSVRPEANDTGQNPQVSADMSAESADTPCNLLSSKSQKEVNRGSKKEPRSRDVALAKRGSRLSSAATLSNEDREFAWTLGFDDGEIKKIWAEFVDYWSAVPGHRGLKLRWSATWRNRVREVYERKANGKRSDRSGAGRAGGDYLAGIAKVAAALTGDGSVAGPTDQEVPLGRVNIEGQRTRNG